MKKLLLLILAISLLTGCSEVSSGLVYKSYSQVEGYYVAIFETDKGESVKFITKQEHHLKALEEDEKYKVSYFYSSPVDYDYTIRHIEIYNEALEKEQQ